MEMRIPTSKEYNRLVDLTDGDDDKMHWEGMFSWVEDADTKHYIPSDRRAVRGWVSARLRNSHDATYRNVDVGFRPAVKSLRFGTLVSDAHDGVSAILGTLYMGDKPVVVPQKPTWGGDITAYIPGAKLEMRKALDDPRYQVKGFCAGGVFIADRVMLTAISYEDIEKALSIRNDVDQSCMVTEICPHCESEIEMRWNTDTMGFKEFCPVCGRRLMLCDECRHCPDAGSCDYDRDSDSCKRSAAVPEG